MTEPEKKVAKEVIQDTSMQWNGEIHVCKTLDEFLDTPGPVMTPEEWEAAQAKLRSLPSPQVSQPNNLFKP